MEYRGYDSVGVATLFRNRIEARKETGRVSEVNQALLLDSMPGTMGIGHTRWATHGGVNSVNAHPHLSNSNDIAIVHNGIIENYQELRAELRSEGYRFRSETDSEIIANLLQKRLEETGSIRQALLFTVSKLTGNFAFIALFKNGTLAAARYREPLIIGVGRGDYFLSSDVLGFAEYTDDAIFLGDQEAVIIDPSSMEIFNFDGEPIHAAVSKIAQELLSAQKGEFSHFTLKEIYEQPTTVLRAAKNDAETLETVSDRLAQCKNLYLVGSGTSYHAAVIGCYFLSKFAKIRAEPLIASEVPFVPHFFGDDSVLLAFSQSGESADILNAVGIAKREGAEIYSIVNSMTSSLARESSFSIGLNCGPEIGVAATKSFTSQLAVIYKLTDYICGGAINPNFREVSRAFSKILADTATIKKISKRFREASDIYVLGRGIHYPIALEGSLKIKEITYIHAEGLPGGELKHGPLALMNEDAYVVLVNPTDSTHADTLTGAHEIKARGGKIIGISNMPNEIYDHWIELPSVSETLYPLVESVPLQLLAYYASLERNADPDYPRNLAKCVTVR